VSNMLRTMSSNTEDMSRKDAPKEASPMVEVTRADRRARRRSLLDVPMLARWRDDREHEVKISSRDLGDGGIFFYASSDIAIGTEVEVTFTIPSDPGARGNRRLRVQGSVIRAERGAERTGYALSITNSELLETEDTAAQVRQVVRRLAANDASSSGPGRARRGRLLFVACSLAGLIMLAVFVMKHPGGSAKAVAAIREMVAGASSIPDIAPPPDAPQDRVERNRKVSRTDDVMAGSSPAEHEAAELSPDASAAPLRSLTGDSAVLPPPVAFNNNNVRTLDFQKGKPVSELGYIGELTSPPAKPVHANSLPSASTRTDTAAVASSSTAVVLQAVVGADGRIEDAQWASGPVELTPAAIAAIRRWKFQPDPGKGAVRRPIYITVNFTVSTQ